MRVWGCVFLIAFTVLAALACIGIVALLDVFGAATLTR